MLFTKPRTASMPDPRRVLPGRDTPLATAETHAVNGRPLKGPWPEGMETAVFGLGCFWGAERIFWQAPGVYVTAVGYAAGTTPNPTYDEVCSGRTGHNEVVLVVFDPKQTTYEALVRLFFESHDPTQGMRQGNDVGTQYRSGIYITAPDQKPAAEALAVAYGAALGERGHGALTTEILPLGDFYHAEAYHQQYLHKNPGGYCGLGGTGVVCPIGTGVGA